jgi:Xaa-Pro aminopeptidase
VKYTPLPSHFYTRNRDKVRAKIKPGSLAILFSAPLLPSNADAYHPFEQDSNFFYLTGIDQEHCVVVITSESDYLFIPHVTQEQMIWEGEKHTLESASRISGIANVHYASELENFLRREIPKYDYLYLDVNEHVRAKERIESPASRFLNTFLKTHFPLHPVLRLAPILYELRMYKEPEEIEQIRKACEITAETYKAILHLIKPGCWEYEIEAAVWYGFLKRRATKPAYPPIIATGKNATVLHYVANNCQCQDGELLLMDIGAEYGHYSADLTRTVPVNGRFTKQQRQYYQIVLDTLNYATSLLRPGKTLEAYHQEVKSFLQEKLLEIGLLSLKEIKEEKQPFQALSRYFMHGVSHSLGLDTHDVTTPSITFAPNMVFTCEPGLYIREEGIGIRLENDILITETGNENLLASAPIEMEEIEAMMNGSS